MDSCYNQKMKMLKGLQRMRAKLVMIRLRAKLDDYFCSERKLNLQYIKKLANNRPLDAIKDWLFLEHNESASALAVFNEKIPLILRAMYKAICNGEAIYVLVSIIFSLNEIKSKQISVRNSEKELSNKCKYIIRHSNKDHQKNCNMNNHPISQRFALGTFLTALSSSGEASTKVSFERKAPLQSNKILLHLIDQVKEAMV